MRPGPALLLLLSLSAPLCAETLDKNVQACLTLAQSSPLLNGFEVKVCRKNSDGTTVPGQKGISTANAVIFGFPEADNPELLVKVLDGRTVNGAFWIFYASLSKSEYTIQVKRLTDIKLYVSPAGILASIADVRAFPNTAKLLAAAVNQCSETTTGKINFTFSPFPMAESEVTFRIQAESTLESKTTCIWRFGDINDRSNDHNYPCNAEPIHVYQNPGTYCVQLNVTQSGNYTDRSSTIQHNVEVGCNFTPPQSPQFSSGEACKKIIIDSNCSWSADATGISFLRKRDGFSRTGSLVTICVSKNSGPKARSGKIGFFEEDGSLLAEMLITQPAKGKPFATPKVTSINIKAQGGSQTLDVEAPPDSEWTIAAVSDPPFLTITSVKSLGSPMVSDKGDAPVSGKGNGTVTYRVDPNPGPEKRTGMLVLTSIPGIGNLKATFFVTQEGPCVYQITPITPESFHFDALGGIGIMRVTTSPNCSWQATSENNFLAFPKALGNGSKEGQYCVATNSSDGAGRQAIFHVGDEDINVSQSSPDGSRGCGVAPRDPSVLCLLGRFELRATVLAGGQNRRAMGVRYNSKAGYFYFCDRENPELCAQEKENIELVAKVLPVGDGYLFSFGSASNQPFAVTLYDTKTGASRLYCNPGGTMKSVADENVLPR